MGVALSMGVVHQVGGGWVALSMGVAHPWGFDFGPYLVEGWQGWWHPWGGGGKAKVSSSLNHGVLQYYFAPFSKAAK